jgi:hypothetical protein
VAQLTAAATATLPAGGSFGLSLAALAALAGAHRRRGRLPG